MKNIDSFDIVNTPLNNGQFLIEASAGTGKTYAIANIYLRLLLERDLHPSQILVVTFTVAATAELRDRLRKNLKDALKYLSDRDLSVDRNVQDIIQSSVIKKSEIVIMNILRRSLLDFDEAAIFTIHSFCLNMLSENAFESGSLFDIEMIKNQNKIIDEVIEDYWRCLLYNSSALSAIVKSSGISINEIKEGAYYIVKNPDILFLPEDQIEMTPEELCSKINVQMDSIVEYWNGNKTFIIDGFESIPLNMAAKRDKFLPLINSFKEAVKLGLSYSDNLYNIRNFTVDDLKSACSAKKRATWEPIGSLKVLTDLCSELKDMFDMFALSFVSRLYYEIKNNKVILDKKQQLGVRSYIDLLTQMRAGLSLDGKPNSEHPLASRIRNQFKVALIDEFQDTDPIQFEVFTTIFDYPGVVMFMIGDPKQSIYRFRGADIFAYLEAKKNPKIVEYTLDTNYRTIAPLVKAVDQWFDNKNSPESFVYKELEYNGVKAAKENQYSKIEIDSDYNQEQPFTLYCSTAGSKPKAIEITATHTANKIAELLSLASDSKLRIIKADCNGKKTLSMQVTPKNIAVLVRRNVEAGIIHKALNNVNVPSVIQSTGNIFKTDEALDVLRVLEAIAENNNLIKLKTALSGKLIGLTPFDLYQMTSEDKSSEYEYWLELFSYYKVLWQEKGFMKMFHDFLEPEESISDESSEINSSLKKNVRANLLLNGGGERSLTNILHLAELIHKESVQNKLGIDPVIQWLFEKINSDENELESDEYEIRLDTDAEAVQIITIHSSKGLEYPIVFCPYLWTKGIKPYSSSGLRNYAFHKDGKQYCDLENPESHESEVVKENLAEEIRLMYVAMTRAVYRLYVHYVDISRGSSRQTAIYYLLNSIINGKTEIDSDSSLNRILKDINIDLNSINLINSDIDFNFSKNIGIGFESKFQTDISKDVFKEEKLADFNNISCDWGVMSYSSLVGGSHNSNIEKEQSFGEVDLSQLNHIATPEIPMIETKEYPETSFFHFPRKGKFTGLFCHEILESFMFDSVMDDEWKGKTEFHKIIESKLLNYGLMSGKKGTVDYDRLLELRNAQVFDMLTKVLTTPLPEIDDNFRLCKLNQNTLTKEMEFYYPVNQYIVPKKINDAFSKYSFKKLRCDKSLNIILDNSLIKFKKGVKLNQGYMTGSIDLVFTHQGRFYIADWKGSWLGSQYEDFTKESLLENMAKSGYFLQHNLYALALHCFLKAKLKNYNIDPEKKFEDYFGGVFYFYVRGMDGLNSDYGYIFDKPEFSHINKLSNDIIGKK